MDRLELEEQARTVFTRLLSADFTTVVYKESREDWRKAQIVVSTVQSLLFNDKYRSLFSPTDFDLVISDEAHRSISGEARGVFEFFTGYKLGLTATPKDYLHGASNAADPREYERRAMLDTYRTFGCENREPTFRYSLLDGVRDGVLVNPTVVDARTHITTKMLSDGGFVVSFTDEETGEETEQSYGLREYERRFFSEATNRVFCMTFLNNALPDPISGETGKSIVFAVSQNHAARLTQILNEIADVMFPGSYQSDFAVQVTSLVSGAQEYTRQFANNNLRGSANVMPAYKTSKARVCVTVGMMTTGYDCPDLLNLASDAPRLLAHGVRPDQGTRNTAPQLRTGIHRRNARRWRPSEEDRVQAVRLLRRLRSTSRPTSTTTRSWNFPRCKGRATAQTLTETITSDTAMNTWARTRSTLLLEAQVGASGMKVDRNKELFNDETTLSVQSAINRDKLLEEQCAQFKSKNTRPTTLPACR